MLVVMPKSFYKWSIFFLCSISALALKPGQGITYKTQISTIGPCLSSAISTPSEELNCRLWFGNINAAPSIDPSRLLVFTGAGDDYLHLFDHLNAKRIAQIKTIGRVITKTIFSEDGSKIFLGTEKGYLMAFDAYTFLPLFNFYADSKINNNLVISENILYFTTIKDTVYALDIISGTLKYMLERPVKGDRLRLESNANLIITKSEFEPDNKILLAPHADGYISYIDLESGIIKKNIILPKGDVIFPDIVAPLLIVGTKFWASSNGAGVYIAEKSDGRILKILDIKEVVEMAENNDKIYLATPKYLYCLNLQGQILWKNNISSYVSKMQRRIFPFISKEEPRKLFLGRPSKLIFIEENIILATDQGGLGIFSSNTGRFLGVLGNGVGFGPNLVKIDNGVLAVSLGGILYYFTFEA